MAGSLLALLFAVVAVSQSIPLRNVYEYYTEDGINSGLEPLKSGFVLNGKNITIYSGAIHYFRVHPAYWRDRLVKLRAAGLIAVETYVPWNLHEPQKDLFDFGEAGRDMSQFLDLVSFLKIAQEEDLLVLLRPGPYICAEFEFGGLPSWLHRIPGIKMRTSEKSYTERAEKYLVQVLDRVRDLQFTKGGPIIAVQLENEFSTVGYVEGADQQHLRDLKQIMSDNGVVEMLFTSDNFLQPAGRLPEVLTTINFQDSPDIHLTSLKVVQPNRPAMVMEFWTGWYDHWMENPSHKKFTPEHFATVLEKIMTFPASWNMYMFHGGTSFGFMNGGNAIGPQFRQMDVTSYDYDAPLSEAGDYTIKYNITRDMVAKYAPVWLRAPMPPEESLKANYGDVQVEEYLGLAAIYKAAGPAVQSKTVLAMEDLPINNDSGQSYGITWYRAQNLQLKANSTLKISGQVHDMLQVFLDGKLLSPVLKSKEDIKSFGFWRMTDGELTMPDEGSTLDLLVENMGRINFGLAAYTDKKGLYEGTVFIDGLEVENWEITPLEFDQKWIQSLSAQNWTSPPAQGPATGLYKASLEISDSPADTFLELPGWTKGLVFVNSFCLGRYNFLGPQKALYIPAPLLNTGRNEILVYEQFTAGSSLFFSDKPNLG